MELLGLDLWEPGFEESERSRRRNDRKNKLVNSILTVVELSCSAWEKHRELQSDVWNKRVLFPLSSYQTKEVRACREVRDQSP